MSVGTPADVGSKRRSLMRAQLALTLLRHGSAGMRARKSTEAQLLQRIRGEFEEAPGLQLTVDQAVRFWAIDAETCEQVLTALRDMGFLAKMSDGRYRQT
jgi:Fic family protein